MQQVNELFYATYLNTTSGTQEPGHILCLEQASQEVSACNCSMSFPDDVRHNYLSEK